MSRYLFLVPVIFASIVLSSCSSSPSPVLPPAKLTIFKKELIVNEQWQQQVNDLSPSNGSRITLFGITQKNISGASRQGGKYKKRVNIKQPVMAGKSYKRSFCKAGEGWQLRYC